MQTWIRNKHTASLLFERDRTVISRHIRNIFKEGKLEENTSCAKIARQVGGQTHHVVFYNLEEAATSKEFLQVQTEDGINCK